MLKNLKHFLFKNLLMMEKFILRQCSGTEQKKKSFFFNILTNIPRHCKIQYLILIIFILLEKEKSIQSF